MTNMTNRHKINKNKYLRSYKETDTKIRKRGPDIGYGEEILVQLSITDSIRDSHIDFNTLTQYANEWASRNSLKMKVTPTKPKIKLSYNSAFVSENCLSFYLHF